MFLQMSCHAEAQQAIDEQGKLNRVGTDIYVNFRSLNTDNSTHEKEKMLTTNKTSLVQSFEKSSFLSLAVCMTMVFLRCGMSMNM